MSARPIDFAPGAPEASATAPRQLGKYVISHVLGEGAMGIVYKAIDPHIHRPVAIKAIRAPLLSPDAHDLGAATRFRTEAQAAGRLSHPNIVSVYEYGDTGTERYIAMEFVDGTSLLDLYRHGERLPLDDALSVMLQLLDALACAHEQGVWHRDIKPANLLITPEGRLKVTDFGIARIESSDRTHHTTVLGSPGYMAPERYTDEAPDQRVDLFSCGVLLYELLTGEAPFRGSSSAVMYQVLNQNPPAPSSLPLRPPAPERFDAVVARALAKRPCDRFASAAQMRDALCAAADRPIRPTVSIETLVRLRTVHADPPTQVLRRPPAAVSAPAVWSSPSSAPSVLAAPSVPSVPRATPSLPARATVPGVPGVPSAPSIPGWDRQVLAGLEALLLPQIGPVAKLVVRDAARLCQDAGALVARIAEQALEPDERPPFIAAATRAFPSLRAAPRSAPSGPLPVLGSTPMAPEVVEKAQRVLAEHIGPLAGLITRRAAAAASCREQFFTALADHAGDEIDRKALLAQLWKI